MTSVRPAACAASTFCLTPPIGSTRPRRVTSPVMPTLRLTARPVSKEASAVTIVTPALGRAMLFRLPSVELRYPLTLGDLGPGTCRDCTFVARLAGESLRVCTPLADLPPSAPVAVVWL